MATASHYIIQYISAKKVNANTTVTPNDIFINATDNVMIMNTKNVSMSIDGGDKFIVPQYEAMYGIQTDTTTNMMFDKDCVLAIGKLVTV